jgi:hypothetical protein
VASLLVASLVALSLVVLEPQLNIRIP